MKNPKRLQIVVPCFNESTKWPLKEYEAYLDHCPEYISFLFVNDGSTDETGKCIDDLAAAYPKKATTLHMKKNSGKAEAVRQGMLLSLAQSEQDYIAYWDADLATPLGEIQHLYQKIEQFEQPILIMGSRVKILGTTNIQRKARRHYAGRIIATLISKMLRIGVYDTQCGAKLIKATEAKKLMTDKFISKWLFDVELIFRILKMNPEIPPDQKVKEVPLNNWIEKGDSKIEATYFLKIPIELFKIYWKYRN